MMRLATGSIVPLTTATSKRRTRKMTRESRRVAGVLLVVLPTVMIGGVSWLSLLVWDPAYGANQLRQDFWRAGHAHAGVLLLLSLILLQYVDAARLSDRAKWFVRLSAPSSAIFLPVAFFLSVLSPHAREPNAFIYLAYAGAIVLATGVLTLGIGLLNKSGEVSKSAVQI